MNKDEIMYQIKVYDDDYNKNIPDEWIMSLDNGEHYGRARQVYDFAKHRYIVEYASDNYDMHTEIQTLLQENKQLKNKIDKAIDYIKSHCEIIRYENYDKIGNVDGAILLKILDGTNEILGDKENE